ncbi:MAG: hypothetical protein V4687_09910 [Bacteroidota bacterium]
MFQYDLDRLKSYSVNHENNIEIFDGNFFYAFCFPEVGYFNYAFQTSSAPFTVESVANIKKFYLERNILTHKFLVPARSAESNRIISSDNNYTQTGIIAKTVFPSGRIVNQIQEQGVSLTKVDDSNIETYTEIYLNGFEAEGRDAKKVAKNFRTLLSNKAVELYLLKYQNEYVGINVLYNSGTESLLAGGAVLKEFRNNGYHKKGLSYRIQHALRKPEVRNVMSWTYKDGVSYNNMIKLGMDFGEEFMVYEYDS